MQNLDIQLPQAGGPGKGELLSQGGEKARRETRRGKREKKTTLLPAGVFPHLVASYVLLYPKENIAFNIWLSFY